MKKVILAMSCALALMALPSAAQTGNDKPKTAEQVKKDVEQTQAIKTRIDEAQFNPRFVRTLINVQIELTISDQSGTAAPEKKIVSMVVSSGNWGKIRSAGSFFPIGDRPIGVDLNVDARPFVSVDGPIQLELTLNYSPPGGPGKDNVTTARTGINQSLTVVLQSGKPLIVSQSADPVSDRKVVVEVKATVLK
jgi:hypothetical protein